MLSKAEVSSREAFASANMRWSFEPSSRGVYLADELQREPLQPHVIRRALYEACREVRSQRA